MDAIFFPRNDYPNNVEVCAHRMGKSMTYTDDTDTIHSNATYNWYMALAKERGIKTSAFVAYSDFENFPQILNDFKDGKIWFDLYSQTTTPELLLEEETATEENFDMYYNTLWLPSFLNSIGKPPVAISYRMGKTYFEDYVPKYFIGGRHSGRRNTPTDYGIGYGSPNNVAYSKDLFKGRHSTLRWYDDVHSDGTPFSDEMSMLGSLIDETKQNGGWIRNFTHWHNPYEDGYQQEAETYLDLLASKNINDDIYFSGYGEAIAYLVFRQLITKAVMYSPVKNQTSHLVIRLEALNTLEINTNLLQVPISVKFSTVGTPLEGHSIKSNSNLISLGSNQYIVEIPYAEYPYAVIEKVSI